MKKQIQEERFEKELSKIKPTKEEAERYSLEEWINNILPIKAYIQGKIDTLKEFVNPHNMNVCLCSYHKREILEEIKELEGKNEIHKMF